MHSWRITKYNPKFRDEKGAYKREEWTSIYDRGKTFDDIEVTNEAYLDIENRYIATIIFGMEERGIDYLEISGLELGTFENHFGVLDSQLEELHDRLKEGMRIPINEIHLLGKIILRETAWARLVNGDFFVHFGYDYYMYLGCAEDLRNTRKWATENGLFVEAMKSPYSKEE